MIPMLLGEMVFYVSWLVTWLIFVSPYFWLARDRTEKRVSKDIIILQQSDIIERQKELANAAFTALVNARMKITRLEGEMKNG